MSKPPALSIIVPVLNEASAIADALHSLADLRRRGTEVIVVDGGSRDDTLARAAPHADQALTSARGRAVQLNAGARAAGAEVLLFLHADTRLPADADTGIYRALADSAKEWGRFDVRIEGSQRLAARHRLADEPPVVPDRHRHRRSGDFRDPPCL